ncbi:MAG: hypothetical protein ACREHV_14715, partial [Rhizomicrobium sp.]
ADDLVNQLDGIENTLKEISYELKIANVLKAIEIDTNLTSGGDRDYYKDNYKDMVWNVLCGEKIKQFSNN